MQLIQPRERSLENLKELVTTEPSSTIPQVTGIQPHIEHMQKLNDCMDLVREMKEGYKSQSETITQLINESIKQRLINGGTITQNFLTNIIEQQQQYYVNQLNVTLTDFANKSNLLSPNQQIKEQQVVV